MGAITNFRLGIDAQVSGEEQIKALQDRMNEFASQLDNHRKTAAAFPEGFAGWSDKIKEAISNPLQSAGSAMGAVLDNIGPLGTKLAATAGILAGVGIVAFGVARQMGELAVSINNTALRMGLGAKQVGEFGFAAKLAGSDIGTLEGAMRKLSIGLADSSADGEKARLGLAALGVSARDANGELRPTNDIFLDISKGLAGMGNAAERNAAAVKIFGRAGIELIPVLMGLAENVAKAKDLGLGLDEKTVRALEDAHKELAGIEAAWEKLAREPKVLLTVEIARLLKWMRGDEADDKGPMTPQEKDLARRRQEDDASPQSKIDSINSSLKMYERFGDPLSVARTANLRKQLGEQQELLSGEGKRILDQALGGGAVGQHDLNKQLEAARKNQESVEGEARGLQQNKNGVMVEPAQAMAARVAEARQDVASIEAKIKALHDLAENAKKVAAALQEMDKAANVGESPFLKQTQGWVEKLKELKMSPAESKQAYSTLGQIMTQEDHEERGKQSAEWEKTVMESNRRIIETAKRDWEEVYQPLEEQAQRRAAAVVGLGKEGIDYRSGNKFAGAQRTYRLASGLFSATAQSPAAGIEFNYASQVDLAGKKYDIEHRRLEEMIRYEPVETQALKLQTDTLKLKADAQRSMDDARMEREVAYAQLQKQTLDQYKDGVGRVFDAALGGGAGLRALLNSTLISNARQIAMNVGGKFFQMAGGEGGTLGKSIDAALPAGLKGMLKGTLLDPRNIPLDANTVALNTLTAAITGRTIAGASAGAGSAAGGTGGLVGAFKQLFSSGSSTSSQGPTWVGNGSTYGTDAYGNPTFGNPTYQETSQGYALGAPTTFAPGGGAAKWVAGGAAVAGGAFAAYNGFSHGGGQGAMEGLGGLAGAASGVLALAGVTGPAAPIVAGVGLALGMVAALMGDPHQRRANELSQEAVHAAYNMPTGTQYTVDSYGRNLNYSSAGQARVVININALDSKSITDRAADISEAIRMGLNSYPPLRAGILAAIQS